MANRWIELVLALLVLTFGGAAEELSPKLLGVGFPFLLSAVLVCAARRSAPTAFLFAVVAGAVEDALSSLPFLTSVSVFLLVVVGVRRFELRRSAAAVAYPLYQLWLGVWLTDLQGSVFLRVLLALPVGVVTAAVTYAVLCVLERRSGVDEKG